MCTTPHISTGQNILKKYWEKINIDIINCEKLFDRSADNKYCAIYRESLILSYLLLLSLFCNERIIIQLV